MTKNIYTYDWLVENKYAKWYFNIIENARNRPAVGYTEKHHIIPRSLGGSDNPPNLIHLTAREHFICHYLLTKMIHDKTYLYKMVSAFMIMKASPTKSHKRYFNSRLYDAVKSLYSKSQSEKISGKNNPNYGKTFVANWESKTCIRIDVDQLDYYLSLGWYNRRIIDFDQYMLVDNEIKTRHSVNSKVRTSFNRLNKKTRKFVADYYHIDIVDLTENHYDHYREELHNFIWVYDMTPKEIMNLLHPNYTGQPYDYFRVFNISTRSSKESGNLMSKRYKQRLSK